MMKLLKLCHRKRLVVAPTNYRIFTDSLGDETLIKRDV